MADKLEGFALRLPPDIKAAAVALSKLSSVYVLTAEADGGTVFSNARLTGSINDVLNSLLWYGMVTATDIINQYLEFKRHECAPWKEITKFFLDHPPAINAVAMNFAEGSAARKLVDDLMEREGEDFPDGVDKHTAIQQLSLHETEIWKLTEALGALQRAEAAREASRRHPARAISPHNP